VQRTGRRIAPEKLPITNDPNLAIRLRQDYALSMTASVTQSLWDEIQTAPEPVQAEVLDFLRFIKSKGNVVSPKSRIQMTPGVCGGEACIGETRMAVWMLEESRRAGVSDAGLLEDYPALDARDLAAAWEYVETHSDEIERAIRAKQAV
jgi:uncharacterized protein (DUF433 family)